jgi:hypothetical protein
MKKPKKSLEDKADKNGSLGNKPRRGQYIQCTVCGVTIYRKPSQYKERKSFFCSYKCKGSAESVKKKLICEFCGKPFLRYPSSIKWNEIRERKGTYCSKKCQGLSVSKRGEESTAWKGGLSRGYKTGYHSSQYRDWRESVFIRDNYTCQYCHARGAELNAHHIFGFTHFPEFRFSLDNGVTLCAPCHETTKKFGDAPRLIQL